MKQLLGVIFLLFFSITLYSQTTRFKDTTFFSSTIADSSNAWSSFTVPTVGTYELLNFGADTIFYKIQSDAPDITQYGIELPPQTSSGLFELYKNAVIWFLERKTNGLFSKFTIKWQ